MFRVGGWVGCGWVKIKLSHEIMCHAHYHKSSHIIGMHPGEDIWEETSEERHLGMGIQEDSGKT